MRTIFRFTAPLVALAALVGMSVSVQGKGTRGLATISGTVRDNKGMPLAGAVIQLIREGANQIVRQTRTGADGSFSAKVPAGRYSLRAIAEGFNDVLFSSVQVNASAEIAYRFNLEPANSPNTLVNQRKDKENVKWTLRSVQGRRSIFQANEGDDSAIAAVEGDDVSTAAEEKRRDEHGGVRTQGILETYFAASTNPFASAYEGVNFAVALPVSESIDLIFDGQSGTAGAPQRFEASARWRANERHRLNLTAGAVRLSTFTPKAKPGAPRSLDQMSVRAVDEWIVRDGVVVVLGVDYSRFMGAGNASAISPRLGIRFDANARTRVHAAYAPGGQETEQQSSASFESGDVVFKQPNTQPIAFVGGRAVMGQSRRLEFGIERVLDNRSRVEATTFLDLTSGRGVGLMTTPLSAFSGENEAAIQHVANQEGSARGVRMVYSRRLSHGLSASAGYSFGRGQKLSSNGLTNPAEFFSNSFFQTAALQVTGDWSTGTHVQTVFRFSPQATVFAIDPFAGRLAVYDPSLSIQVTQDLPTFGLPVRAQAVVDARNLLDFQSRTGNGEALLEFGPNGRSLRGGIAVRF
ncbi:MAG TPA: carboxypeptidase-like regulatory domain-containing protein [Pyrinomonadaceae bacterium]|nr:carboxypeptidase-like regulatory domain-containing protein [Pyrinomonadaceae bacterium]